MTTCAEFFQKPQHGTQIQYEALRAFYHEGRSGKEVAKAFGYSYGSFRNLCHRFRKDPTHTFFWPEPEPPPPAPEDTRPERIAALRKQHGASIYQIAELLEQEGLQASTAHIYRVLESTGDYVRLPRRTASERSVRALSGVRADRRALNLQPRTFETDFGGLFLFAFDLARMGMDDLLEGMPGSDLIPAGCAVRSLLALKLWGIGRPSQIMAETLDEGLALFAGLNAIPKRSTLSEYSARCDPHFTQELLHRWFDAVGNKLGLSLGGGKSFDLDFHTIPYHGDEAVMEKHFVSKRSRRQRGILTFLARDAEARIFVYADCTLRKKEQNQAVMHFVDYWKARTGTLPPELVFDSRLTTYAYLTRLQELGIDFITLRRRHKKLRARILALPPEEWRQITLQNVGRKYRKPRIVEDLIKVRGYNGSLRQIVIAGLGHDQPTVLITNKLKASPVRLVDRYARRMIIENVISDAIDFFHMDALSAAVPMKINVDVQLTVMASVLYRILGIRVGEGLEVAETRTIYRKLVPRHAKVQITDNEIIVTYPRRTNNPYLLNAKYHERSEPIPWLGNKTLRVKFAGTPRNVTTGSVAKSNGNSG